MRTALAGSVTVAEATLSTLGEEGGLLVRMKSNVREVVGGHRAPVVPLHALPQHDVPGDGVRK
jgi:hypothetical protein